MARTDGFVRVPNWLLDDHPMNLYELTVYTVLLRFRNPNTGTCFPGMTTIADLARVSRETVKRTIPLLEEKGLIRVTKRKENGKNFPNEYAVAVATETPQIDWATSRRGRRIPKRTPRNSECLPGGEEDKGRHSEFLGRHSETREIGTPSASNKTYKNKNHGQALTHAQQRTSEQFTFDVDKAPATSGPQLAYLNDLFIHLHHIEPDDSQLARWARFTRDEATEQIRGYLNALGRPADHLYPNPGTPEYEALSHAGKVFATTGGMPASVDDYTKPRKQNAA